jgi:hypothetical protein
MMLVEYNETNVELTEKEFDFLATMLQPEKTSLAETTVNVKNLEIGYINLDVLKVILNLIETKRGVVQAHGYTNKTDNGFEPEARS